LRKWGTSVAGTVELQRLMVRLSGDPRKLLDAYEKVGNASKRVGRAMRTYLTLPLLGVGAFAVRQFSKFDQAMTESTSIMKTPGDQIERMRNLALELSTKAVQGPEELARSYFFLASAGLDAEKAMAALPAVSQFATAGAFDMARATDLLTDAQSALGITSKSAIINYREMVRLSDVLVKANTLANASVEQFSVALTSKAGAALKSVNKDVEEGTAILAAYADQGIKAELAGNTLSRFLLILQKAAISNAGAFRRFGFELYDAQGNMRNFADVVDNLERILLPMAPEMRSATLAAMGFDARIQAAILPLLGTSDAIRRYERELRHAGGTTDEVANKQLKSFGNQLKITWNQIKVAAIGIGKDLAPALLSLNRSLRSLISYWEELSPSVRTAVVAIAAFTAAAGPAMIMAGHFAFALKMLGGSALLTGLALKGLGVALALVAAYSIGKWVHNQLPWIQEYNAEIESMAERHKSAMQSMADASRDAFDAIAAAEGIDRGAAIDTAIDSATSSVRQYTREVQDAQRQVDEMNEGWWAFAEEIEANEQRLEQALQRQARARKNLNDLVEERKNFEQSATVAAVEAMNAEQDAIDEIKEKVETLTDKLKESYATLGWNADATEIWKLKQQGATDEMLREAVAIERMTRAAEKRRDMLEKGKSVVEKYLTPFQKLRKEHAELLQLRRMGAIDQGTYHRGNMQLIEQYKSEMDALKKKAVIKISVDTSAVRGGTAEFANMLASVRPEARFSYEGRKDQKSFKRMETHLERLVSIEEERMRRGAEIGVAGL